MHSSNKIGRRFQPRISKHNSAKFSELPDSVPALARYLSLEQLEVFSQFEHFSIMYILTENSSKTDGRLIPLRDSNRNFCVLVLRAV